MILSFSIISPNPLRIHSDIYIKWFIAQLLLFLSANIVCANESALYDRERIVIEPANVNFGTIRSSARSTVISEEVKVENRSEQLVEIKQVKPSCSCTKPHIQNTIISPGDSTTLTVGIDLTGIQGEKSTNVALLYADKSVTVLPITVTVVDVIHFSTNSLQATFPIDGILKKQFAFSRFISAKQKDAISATCTADSMDCMIVDAKFIEQKDTDTKINLFVASVNIDVSKLAIGKHEGSMQIKFSDEVSAAIPYSINVLPSLSVQRINPAIIHANSKPSSLKLFVCHSPTVSDFQDARIENQKCRISKTEKVDNENTILTVDMDSVVLKKQGCYTIEGNLEAINNSHSHIKSTFQIAIIE